MLTYVATLILSLLVHGAWRDPDGFNFPESRLFSDSATLPIIWEGTRLHFGWLITIAAVIAVWVLMSRTIIGFQVKVIGQAPQAGRYAGFSVNRTIWFSLMLGGGMAGMAGLFEVAGPIGQLLPSISPRYRLTAIILASVGRLHPIGVFFCRVRDSALLSGRGIRADHDEFTTGRNRCFPRHAVILFTGLRCVDYLPDKNQVNPPGKSKCMTL